MPSPLHEALRELFGKDPSFLTEILATRLPLPQNRLVPLHSEQSEPRVKQLLPDVMLGCPDHRDPKLVVVVEVQLSRDDAKIGVWPRYVASAFGRYRCPVELVVVTPYAAVATWAAQTIRIGRQHAMTPTVLGPSAIPRLDEAQVKRWPVVAMLSTLAHQYDVEPPDAAALQALWTFEALHDSGLDADGRLADILLAALSIAVRARMEDLMRTERYEYQSEFARKYFAQGLEEGREEGRAVGQARALLLILRAREIGVDAAAEQRITAEQDEETLDGWIQRAATAARIEDVLGEG